MLTAMLLASPSGARAEGEIVPQSADLVLSVAFGFAVAALTTLTLGVCPAPVTYRAQHVHTAFRSTVLALTVMTLAG